MKAAEVLLLRIIPATSALSLCASTLNPDDDEGFRQFPPVWICLTLQFRPGSGKLGAKYCVLLPYSLLPQLSVLYDPHPGIPSLHESGSENLLWASFVWRVCTRLLLLNAEPQWKILPLCEISLFISGFRGWDKIYLTNSHFVQKRGSYYAFSPAKQGIRDVFEKQACDTNPLWFGSGIEV